MIGVAHSLTLSSGDRPRDRHAASAVSAPASIAANLVAARCARRPQLVTDGGPKLPKPWLVLRIAELQTAKTPRAARSFAFPVQSI